MTGGRNDQNAPNGGAGAAGAGYANRNQPNASNAGAAAAGAGAANRNQPGVSNAGAAAAGAGVANRNQPNMSNAGAAMMGAGYANRNSYNAYHPGMVNGYWNGNYGTGGYGGVGAWGTGSSMYGYGYAPYSNPYATAGGQGQANESGTSGYSQPLDTNAAPPEQAGNDQGASASSDQARQAFRTGDYNTALSVTQQALASSPNDATLHEFLGLILFAQGNYDAAAAPLYAVLSVGPGWNWTTLIGNYDDANVYTEQLRALETYVKQNPMSASASFVLAYQYLCQGQGDAAIKPLTQVVALMPGDQLAAQLLAKLQPGASAEPSAPPVAPGPAVTLDQLKGGAWQAAAQGNGTITLTVKDDASFEWDYAVPGKPATTVSGTATVENDVLSLDGSTTKSGPLTGQVTFLDARHFTFRAVGSPASDPGLAFAR